VIEEPLTPANSLAGMTAVRHNGTVWEETNPNNAGNQWYEYIAQIGNGTTSRWANARDSNQNMFVWIPRYAYRIVYFNNATNANLRRDNPNHTTGLLGYSNVFGMEDATGAERRIVAGTERNITNRVRTSRYSDYIPHPAFTFDGRNLPGIWIGKYATGRTVAQGAPAVQRGLNMRLQQNISTHFDEARAFADNNAIAGTSMMLRNRDWRSSSIFSPQ